MTDYSNEAGGPEKKRTSLHIAGKCCCLRQSEETSIVDQITHLHTTRALGLTKPVMEAAQPQGSTEQAGPNTPADNVDPARRTARPLWIARRQQNSPRKSECEGWNTISARNMQQLQGERETRRFKHPCCTTEHIPLPVHSDQSCNGERVSPNTLTHRNEPRRPRNSAQQYRRRPSIPAVKEPDTHQCLRRFKHKLVYAAIP